MARSRGVLLLAEATDANPIRSVSPGSLFRVDTDHESWPRLFVELPCQSVRALRGWLQAHENPPGLVARAEYQRRGPVPLLHLRSKLLRLSAVRECPDLNGKKVCSASGRSADDFQTDVGGAWH